MVRMMKGSNVANEMYSALQMGSESYLFDLESKIKLIANLWLSRN